MTAERDLAVLLATMEPILSGLPHGFGRLPEGHAAPQVAFALIREAEGTTVIAPCNSLSAQGIPHEGEWARISLTVHSALEAVGLTAALARALADAGISANVVAGYHHDHIFVPWSLREEAMAALLRLSGQAR